MSRSRRKPYGTIAICNYGNAWFKKFHNHILRNKRKKYLKQLEADVDAYAPDEGIKTIDGLDIYCFPSDGGSYWRGYFKEEYPEYFQKIIRK